MAEMERAVGRASLLTIGAPVLLALAFGGGTTPRLAVDAWLLLVLALGATAAILMAPGRPVPRAALPVLVLPPALIALQLVPLPLVGATQGALPAELKAELGSWRPLTLDPAATWDALLWVGTLCLVLLAMLRTRAIELRARFTFVLLAVALQIVVGLLQFTEAVPSGTPLLGYEPRAGFFSNENHFAILLVMSVPFAFAFLGQFGRSGLVAAYVALVLVALLAAGSSMGMMLGVGAVVLSLLAFGDVRRHARVAKAVPRWRRAARDAVLVAFAVAALLVVWRVANDASSGQTRLSYAATTLEAIADNMPFGTGFGTFAPVYERYEAAEEVRRTFVNEAHNEYLQLVLVGGLPGLAVLVAVAAVLIGRMRRGWHLPITRACALALGMLAVHSLVDYPLRTLSVGTMTVFLIALLFEDLPKVVRASAPPEKRASPPGRGPKRPGGSKTPARPRLPRSR